MKHIKIAFRSMCTTHSEKEPQKTTILRTDMESIRVTDTVKFSFIWTEWLVEQYTLGMRHQERSSFVDKHVARILKRSRFHRSVISMLLPISKSYRHVILWYLSYGKFINEQCFRKNERCCCCCFCCCSRLLWR